MAVYGGDVGLDEFAKHPTAERLWETAQGRVTWGYDAAVWSAHDGEDTLFYQFAQEAREGKGPWNLYYRVTMPDAIELGLLEVINRVRGTSLTAEQFLTDCRARARLDSVFQQSYLCNPLPGAACIADWAAIERCRFNYEIERVHFEHSQIMERFGAFWPGHDCTRERDIKVFLQTKFPALLKITKGLRLGFDVAASGQGDLAVIYVDEANGSDLWLRGLFTCRTDDWHFLKTVLFWFLHYLKSLRAAGDETGLGRQICWEAAARYGWAFKKVNFSGKKADLGFALMNQLATAQKRFPKSEQDVAADFFALRKLHNGNKWAFSEGANALNPASHCDIAWAGALATHAHGDGNDNIAVTLG
jgi:phage FluMu gp28-like protein